MYSPALVSGTQRPFAPGIPARGHMYIQVTMELPDATGDERGFYVQQSERQAHMLAAMQTAARTLTATVMLAGHPTPLPVIYFDIPEWDKYWQEYEDNARTQDAHK